MSWSVSSHFFVTIKIEFNLEDNCKERVISIHRILQMTFLRKPFYGMLSYAILLYNILFYTILYCNVLYCKVLFFHSYVQMVINEFGNLLHCESLKLTLEVPPKALDKEVPVEICAVCEEEAPTIPCDFGEFILSDIIQIHPLALRFSKPAFLSIDHGVNNLPELSCAAIKCFDLEKKEWVELPLVAGRCFGIL